MLSIFDTNFVGFLAICFNQGEGFSVAEPVQWKCSNNQCMSNVERKEDKYLTDSF